MFCKIGCHDKLKLDSAITGQVVVSQKLVGWELAFGDRYAANMVNDDSQPHTAISGENVTPDGRFDTGVMPPQ